MRGAHASPRTSILLRVSVSGALILSLVAVVGAGLVAGRSNATTTSTSAVVPGTPSLVNATESLSHRKSSTESSVTSIPKGERLLPAKQIQVTAALALQGGPALQKPVRSANVTADAVPAVPFTECPAIGEDTSCEILVVVTDSGTSIYQDPSQGPFDGIEDTLIGVLNESSQPLGKLELSGDTDLFGFDGDGICSGDYPAWNGSAQCPYGSTGYEGPDTSFSDINEDASGGIVDFPTALAPNGTTYFSLEEALTASTVVSGGPTASEQGGAPNGSERRTVCPTKRPVNCASGEFWHQFTDFDIPGRGVPLDFTRTYTSGNASTNGPLGYGWTDSYNWSLSIDASGDVTVNQDDGSTVAFTSSGGGTFTAPPRVLASLVQNGDGSYTFTRFSDGIGYNFSSSGVLESEVDRNGYVTTLNYSGTQLTSVSDPVGRQLTFTYSGSNISQLTDPLGRTMTFQYDSSGNLVKTTDAAGRSWSFTYDPNHLLLTMTDPNGGTTTNTYDSSDRVVDQVDPMGQSTTWSYSGDPTTPIGGTTTITDPQGSVTVENYANLELNSETTAAGTAAAATTTYTYDPATLGVATKTDPDGHVTTDTYDADGNELTTSDALGNTTTFTYNGFNEVTSKETPLGETTSYSYDGNGNLLTISDPLNDVYLMTYGDSSHPGDLTSVTDPDGRITALTYDAQGDEASVTVSPSTTVHDTTEYVYDEDGERTCIDSADAVDAGIGCPPAGSARVPGTTSRTYDADGELTAITSATGGTTTDSYDADGNLTKEVDPDGNVTSTTYDLLDRPVAVTTGASGSSPSTTTSEYDLAPGSSSCPVIAGATYCDGTVDASGGVTTSHYNAANEVIERTLPGGQSVQSTYDEAGNNISQVDASGRTTSYTFDADNRVTAIDYSDGTTPNVTYSYDADAHRTGMTDGTGTTTYTYDADGRLTSTTDGAGSTVAYTYDGEGDIGTLTYPGGRVVAHTYDGADRLASIADGGGNTTTFTYDADGNLTGTVYPNGDTVSSTYDAADQLKSTGVGSTSDPANQLASIAYTRDAAGQITQESDSGGLSGISTYSYDARNQLTNASGGTYSYDTLGDLTGLPNDVTQVFNAAQELSDTSSTGGVTNYAYDAEGERTTATSPTSTTTYGYNQAGELTSLASSPTTPAAPTVTKISPTSGPAGGGTTVTITGTALSGATAVSFAKTAATSVVVNSATSITAKSPAGTGTVDVTVTTPVATSATSSADQFTYQASPTVTKISPTSGPAAGGTTVTITGTALSGATAVSFAKTAATSVVVNSATSVTAKSPAGTGTVDVTVTTPVATSATSSADQFTYQAARKGTLPVVLRLSPRFGPDSGHTLVLITGKSLQGTTAVHFGRNKAKFFGIFGSIVAISPPGTGTVDVTVTTASGTSSLSWSDRYRYLKYRGSKPSPVLHHSFGTSSARATPKIQLTALVKNASVGAATITPSSATYAYNGDGLRMNKSSGGVTQQFGWDTNESIPELLGDGSATYIYGPDGLPIEQITSGGQVSYYFHDSLGSTRLLLDSTGTIAASYSYGAYGATVSSTGTTSTPLEFSGAYEDSESGLYYLINRYYDATTGQFLSIDPDLSTTGQPFEYADDDPINEVDPNGTIDWDPLHYWRGLAQSAVTVGVAAADTAIGVAAAACDVATAGICVLPSGVIVVVATGIVGGLGSDANYLIGGGPATARGLAENFGYGAIPGGFWVNLFEDLATNQGQANGPGCD
jgi:RHS repeat-associated protein